MALFGGEEGECEWGVLINYFLQRAPKLLIPLYFQPRKKYTTKNILKICLKKFGSIKKINSSLQRKTKFKQQTCYAYNYILKR